MAAAHDGRCVFVAGRGGRGGARGARDSVCAYGWLGRSAQLCTAACVAVATQIVRFHAAKLGSGRHGQPPRQVQRHADDGRVRLGTVAVAQNDNMGGTAGQRLHGLCAAVAVDAPRAQRSKIKMWVNAFGI